MFQAFVFDLDGTLCDSREDIVAAANYGLKAIGEKTITVAEGAQYIGHGAEQLFEDLLPNSTPEIRKVAFQNYLTYYEKNPLVFTYAYENVAETLSVLSLKSSLYVVTNKDEPLAVVVLKNLGIEKYFVKVIGAGTYPYMKPNPYALQQIIASTSLSPHSILMVGDTDVDIQFGVNGGVKTCRFESGYGAMGNARNVKEDFTVFHFQELTKYVS